MPTRPQVWSKHAFDSVKSHSGKADEESKYKTICMKMPALIQQSGLVQALAFTRSRGEEERRFVDELARATGLAEKGEDLFRKAQTAELAEYMTLTHCVQEVAVWFRRFAQSELQAEDGEP